MIDPLTGKEEGEQEVKPTQEEDIVKIKKDDWERINQRLDMFEKYAFNANPQPQQQYQAPQYQSDIANYEKRIAELDTEIDSAVTEGRPPAQLIAERSKLERQITRLQIKYEDIDPAINQGAEAVSQLTAQVSRGSMKHFDVVKKDMDEILSSVPVNQRMQPKALETAYQLAVGRNMEKILKAQNEEILRNVAKDPSLVPGAINSRNTSNMSGFKTDPKTILSKDALDAIKMKGISIDEEFKRRGYSGWDDYYEKVKKPFEDSMQ